MPLESLHFLRPEYLYLLIPAAAAVYLVQRSGAGRSAWRKVIDPKLLPFLLDGAPDKDRRWPAYALALSLVLATLALAGPAWKKLPQSVDQKQDALLILLDLSLSMQAADVAPSRIERARLKIRDVLAARKEGLTALIAYAGDAHTVAPFTDDTGTLEAMLPALEPEIMPRLGNRPERAMALAKQLMQDASIQSARFLMITDEILPSQAAGIREGMPEGVALSILSVGTGEGGPIPLSNGGFLKSGDEIIVVETDFGEINAVARNLSAKHKRLQSGSDDIDYLLAEGLEDSSVFSATEREFDVWQDEGIYLVLLLMPFVLLLFRRGWVLLLCVVIMPSPAQAIEWRDLWERKDQQAQSELRGGNAANAQKLFEHPQWKGSAAFRAGDFDAAAKLFSNQNHYNQGNALARAGKLDEALAAYDKELAANPGNEDAAFNKKVVEELKREQEQQQKQQENQNEQSDSDGSEGDKEKPEDQQQNQDGQEGDQQGKGSPSQGDDEKPPEPSQQNEQQDQEQQSGQDDNQQEQQSPEQQQSEQGTPEGEQSEEADAPPEQAAAQAQKGERQEELEQWLRKVPDDPGGLLRNKFHYQSKQNQRDQDYVDESGTYY